MQKSYSISSSYTYKFVLFMFKHSVLFHSFYSTMVNSMHFYLFCCYTSYSHLNEKIKIIIKNQQLFVAYFIVHHYSIHHFISTFYCRQFYFISSCFLLFLCVYIMMNSDTSVACYIYQPQLYLMFRLIKNNKMFTSNHVFSSFFTSHSFVFPCRRLKYNFYCDS